jgi:multidrug transporter EmrE-like cation transporter
MNRLQRKQSLLFFLNEEYMSLQQILGITFMEIIGDFSLKEYSRNGGVIQLVTGILGYVGVIILLVVTLQHSTVLFVNAAWDGISGLIESIFAFIFLGERFENALQYLGGILIISGLFLLKIPWSTSHVFHIPA